MNGAQDNARYGLTDQSNLSSGSNNVDLYNNSGMVLNFHWASAEYGLYCLFFYIFYLVNAYSLSLVANISVDGFVQ